MVFNTATVGTAVTPVVVQTFLSHYLNRKPLAKKPTAHISYHEGLELIRQFLLYASHHTVEDIQRFTSQWVPSPTWVKVEEVKIPQVFVTKAAEAIQEQLGRHGIERVGGRTWWQWRRPGSELKAEWIEMKADFEERKRTKDSGKRVMLYVHGGAYFFGSVDEHRYQMQRHARKLKARVFARSRYRLAPQFPFPCGLHDCVAAYLYLLSVQDPSTIIFAGDSAGGGMVVSMLVTIRDRGLPPPAGAVLISPWVDLTHSFPSVSGDNSMDYLPAHGFHQRPSKAWPPPNSDDVLAMNEEVVKKMAQEEHNLAPQVSVADAVKGFHEDDHPDRVRQNTATTSNTAINGANGATLASAHTVAGPGQDLSIMIDGNLVQVKDQIQMYTTNQLLSHPLVSPILQPSLGGLPPLLILTGGGELLKDEQIYLAHKAAHPAKYPPADAFLDDNPHDQHREHVHRWKPTDVQLQVWDDLCHVAPTLSFTRPAKYMYRSIAQFGAWALARAQKTEIEILDDDDVSIISQSDSDDDDQTGEQEDGDAPAHEKQFGCQIGKAGDPLPPFKHHMIRQRVDRHGNIYHLEPASELIGCNFPVSEIGIIKQGPVRKWLAVHKEWGIKYAGTTRKIQKKRAQEMAKGYQGFGDGEVPPPSALAGRRKSGEDLHEEKKKRSTGMSLWSMWGSKHDEKTIDNEQEAAMEPQTTVVSTEGSVRPSPEIKRSWSKSADSARRARYSRSGSRRRAVTDERQTGNNSDVDENAAASELTSSQKGKAKNDGRNQHDHPNLFSPPSILVRSPTGEGADPLELDLKRPKSHGIAFPFSLKKDCENASMVTLTSSAGVSSAEGVVEEKGVSGIGVEEGTGDFDKAADVERVPDAEKAPNANMATDINKTAGDEDAPEVEKVTKAEKGNVEEAGEIKPSNPGATGSDNKKTPWANDEPSSTPTPVKEQ